MSDVMLSGRAILVTGAARGLGEARIAALNEWATDGLVPDLTVLIDVDAATAADRRDRRLIFTGWHGPGD